jgi:hypothetical protein
MKSYIFELYQIVEILTKQIDLDLPTGRRVSIQPTLFVQFQARTIGILVRVKQYIGAIIFVVASANSQLGTAVK